MNRTDLLILEVASRQHWLAHRNQLREVGVSDTAIARRVSSGLLVRAQPEVVRVAAAPTSSAQGALGACLSAGPGTAGSHRTAATLWGAPGLVTGMVEVVVPETRRPRLRGVTIHRSAYVPDHHRTVLGGVPVTTPERTLLDLGAVVRPFLVERVLEEWLVRNLLTGRSATALLEEMARQGQPGVVALRWALARQALADEAPDSRGELVFARLVRDFGLPEPVYHHLVRIGPETFELDFAYPDLMAAIEIDGRTVHERMAAAEADRRRQHLLEDTGWAFRRYLNRQVHDEPARIADEIRRWLRRRRARAA